MTGPRKFDEIMEKLEIIVNETMADDGPTPMDLGDVSGHDAKTTQSDSDMSTETESDRERRQRQDKKNKREDKTRKEKTRQ